MGDAAPDDRGPMRRSGRVGPLFLIPAQVFYGIFGNTVVFPGLLEVAAPDGRGYQRCGFWSTSFPKMQKWFGKRSFFVRIAQGDGRCDAR